MIPYRELSEQTVRDVETALHRYPWTKQEIEVRRRDLATSGGVVGEPGEGGAGRSRAGWSDPTAHRASLIESDPELRDMRRVVRAIEAAVGTEQETGLLSPDDAALVRHWYWQRRGPLGSAVVLHLDRATVYRRRQRIISLVASLLKWQ